MASENSAHFLLGSCSTSGRCFDCPDAGFSIAVALFIQGRLTLCGHFPGGVKRLHWPFDDPAAVEGSDEVREAAFRRIRDQIHGRIMVFLEG